MVKKMTKRCSPLYRDLRLEVACKTTVKNILQQAYEDEMITVDTEEGIFYRPLTIFLYVVL